MHIPWCSSYNIDHFIVILVEGKQCETAVQYMLNSRSIELLGYFGIHSYQVSRYRTNKNLFSVTLKPVCPRYPEKYFALTDFHQIAPQWIEGSRREQGTRFKSRKRWPLKAVASFSFSELLDPLLLHVKLSSTHQPQMSIIDGSRIPGVDRILDFIFISWYLLCRPLHLAGGTGLSYPSNTQPIPPTRNLISLMCSISEL